MTIRVVGAYKQPLTGPLGLTVSAEAMRPIDADPTLAAGSPVGWD